MLRLIPRCKEYVAGYKAYCQELYDAGVVYFRPTDPKCIDEGWFERTKPLYEAKEKGQVEGQPTSFHYWAVDGDKFVGEFQLRTDFPKKVLLDIGSIGYAVRVSEWGKGYGAEILRQGLALAKQKGMDKVLLTINEDNTRSIRLCEKASGVLADTIEADNPVEGKHKLRRYWITL